jgi:hypothetical protein
MLDAGCWMLDAWEEPLPSIQHPASSVYFHSFRASPRDMNDSSEKDAGCWMLDAWEEPLPSIQHPASSIYFLRFRASPTT